MERDARGAARLLPPGSDGSDLFRGQPPRDQHLRPGRPGSTPARYFYFPAVLFVGAAAAAAARTNYRPSVNVRPM